MELSDGKAGLVPEEMGLETRREEGGLPREQSGGGRVQAGS